MTARRRGWLVVALLVGTTGSALAEELTVTTYYPSPRGVYKELRTTDDALLALEGGAVGIGTANPGSKLSVDGGATIGAAYDLLTAPANGLLVQGTVGIGTTSPNASALLDLSSTSQGLLPPRMTTAQRDAIVTPPAGLMLYNTTTGQTEFYDGSAWIPALLWARSPDDPDAIFNTNPGNVGIGITNPGQKLHIVGNIGFGTSPAVTMSTVTGTNPTCPAGSGSFLTRKWLAITCSDVDSCTTSAGWSVATPQCSYLINSSCGPMGTPCIVPSVCSAVSWTDAVCMGN